MSLTARTSRDYLAPSGGYQYRSSNNYDAGRPAPAIDRRVAYTLVILGSLTHPHPEGIDMKMVLVSVLLCSAAFQASAVTIASVVRNPTAEVPSPSAADPQAQFQRICLGQAGSRIVVSPRDTFGARCVTAGGRSYSSEDLDHAIKAQSNSH